MKQLRRSLPDPGGRARDDCDVALSPTHIRSPERCSSPFPPPARRRDRQPRRATRARSTQRSAVGSGVETISFDGQRPGGSDSPRCRFGGREASPGRKGEEVAFPLKVTQTHLADATGLTPVHVNRSLKSLGDEGVVTVSNRMVDITDGLNSAPWATLTMRTCRPTYPRKTGSESSGDLRLQPLSIRSGSRDQQLVDSVHAHYQTSFPCETSTSAEMIATSKRQHETKTIAIPSPLLPRFQRSHACQWNSPSLIRGMRTANAIR